MKVVLAWARSNPMTVGALVVAVVAMVWLLFVHSDGVRFVQQLSQRDQQIKRIESLRRTVVRIPPAKPDDPERQLRIAVNPAAIDQLDRVYRRMNQEYTEIFRLATQLNRQNHMPMLEGLFPESADASKPFEARIRYRALMEGMVNGRLDEPGYPRLRAGPPPTAQDIREVLRQAEASFLTNELFFPPETNTDRLTGQQTQRLDEFTQRWLTKYLLDHARKIHVYTENQITSPDFPLDVGAWSSKVLQPRMSELWEGQMGLWIQQDIIEAIARTNRVDDPKSNVVNAPVKRLIAIRIVPEGMGVRDTRPPERVVRLGDSAGGGDKSQPMADQVSDLQLPDDFAYSPTGRRSNMAYDVRHVRVSLIIDVQQMPRFFDHLRQVNFMTVLMLDVTGVDEYEAMHQGYVYGSGDSVRLDMIIETIWLRDWTSRYMPEAVRHALSMSVAGGSR